MLLPEPPHDTEALPEPIPLDIVYEDPDLLVVNKPAGLVVHPAVGNFTGTLLNGLLYHLSTANDRGSHSSPKLGEVARRAGGVCLSIFNSQFSILNSIS